MCAVHSVGGLDEFGGAREVTGVVRGVKVVAAMNAMAACAGDHIVRDVARITGLPLQTVHRWKTEPPPGQERLQAVRENLRDASCG